MTSTMVQHPVARIQAIIGELQDATHCDEHERQRVMALWVELGNQIVMLESTKKLERLTLKANAYDQIAGIISTTSPPGPKETTDADTDATSGRGHSDRGSSDGPGPGDQTGPGAPGDSGTETD